jgi:hypothetical protein
VLSGGLAGHRRKAHFSGKQLAEFLKPGSDSLANMQFEVRVRVDGSDAINTEYLTGQCVSPEGLVVLPVSPKSLVVDEPIVVYGHVKGTARMVASDEAHGLALVKIESPDQRLFIWSKCRLGRPGKGQMLNGRYPNYQDTLSIEVIDVGQPIPGKITGSDAFVIKVLDSPAINGSVSLPLGKPLMSVDGELQGIVFHKLRPDATGGGPKPPETVFAMPAFPIRKLLDDYRKSQSVSDAWSVQEKQESSDGDAIKIVPKQPATDTGDHGGA